METVELATFGDIPSLWNKKSWACAKQVLRRATA
jgi:hypothetical protein